jgi:PAS domain S-box-containing protein
VEVNRRTEELDSLEVEGLQQRLAEQSLQLKAMQEELEETNRGILALYAELDDQAELLRQASALSDSKFRTIYAQVTSGIALVDASGVILDANPRMCALLGVADGELAQRGLRDFVAPEWQSLVDAFLGHAGIALHQEWPVHRRDGSMVRLEWTMTPEIEPGVAMLVATDVSQRWLDRERVARGDAERDSRIKDEFMAVLAHELRTPLNAISGWTQVLKQQLESDIAKRGLLAIERNSAIQARMIADLLDVSRLRVGKLAMAYERLDPAVEIRAAMVALGPAFEQKGVFSQLETLETHRTIRADSARLQQVVWNLLTNAIKFSPAGSRVDVSLTEIGNELVLRVTDKGQGIPAEFLPKVFDRFAQSDVASNRQRGGLGLGLAIVQQIVEAHDGSVSVTSPGAGLGATFEVRLPIDSIDTSLPTTTVDEEPPDFPLTGLRIVIVDDDADAAEVLGIVLTDRGARFRAASSAAEALRLIAEERPDLLISDVGMPLMDGYELIGKVRRTDAVAGASHLPAIALTSFSRDKDRQQALVAGFDAHCTKPLKPLELVRQVSLLVGRQ